MDNTVQFITFAGKSLIDLSRDFRTWRNSNDSFYGIVNVEVISGKEDYMMIMQYKKI